MFSVPLEPSRADAALLEGHGLERHPALGARVERLVDDAHAAPPHLAQENLEVLGAGVNHAEAWTCEQRLERPQVYA